MIEIYGRKYVHFGLKRLHLFLIVANSAFFESFVVFICSEVI